jgi:hypothetical protein
MSRDFFAYVGPYLEAVPAMNITMTVARVCSADPYHELTMIGEFCPVCGAHIHYKTDSMEYPYSALTIVEDLPGDEIAAYTGWFFSENNPFVIFTSERYGVYIDEYGGASEHLNEDMTKQAQSRLVSWEQMKADISQFGDFLLRHGYIVSYEVKYGKLGGYG